MLSKSDSPSKAGTIDDEERRSDEDNTSQIPNSTSDTSPLVPPELETVSIHPPSSRMPPSVRTSRSSRRRSRAKSNSNSSSPERPPAMNEHLAQGPRAGSPTASIQQAVRVTKEPVVDPGPQDNAPKKSPESPANAASAGLDQATEFWEAYNKTGDLEDKEFVKSSGGDLDVLLIFAGLFSAIDTAFIIESYKNLKSDPADETAKLLRSVILILHNSTYTDATINPPSFTATTRDVRVNAFFFASLCCSLSAAFGAVMAKQWLTQYDQDGGGSLKTPATRGRGRQLKYEGRDQWHLEGVITTLPTLLQLSLFFFFVGLSDFILLLNTTVASVIISFAGATFLFYAITMSISVIDRGSPFQTRLSSLLCRVCSLPRRVLSLLQGSFHPAKSYIYALRYQGRFWKVYKRFMFERMGRPYLVRLVSILPFVIKCAGEALAERLVELCQRTISPKAIPEQLIKLYHGAISLPRQAASWLRQGRDTPSIASPTQSLESRCVIYLLERMTVPKDLDMLAEVVALLPDGSGAMAIAETLNTFHLKPVAPMSEDDLWLFPGLRGSSSITMMKILGTTVGKWKCFESNRSVIQSTPVPSLNNRLLRHSLLQAIWNSFLANPGDVELYRLTYQIFHVFSYGKGYEGVRFKLDMDDSVDAMLANLQSHNELVQDHTLHLVCMLPSIGCLPWGLWSLVQSAASQSPLFVEKLQSTMWIGSSQEAKKENLWLQILRLQVLPWYQTSSNLDSQFAGYLASWFNGAADSSWQNKFPQGSFRYDQIETEQVCTYWTYLLRLCHLMNSENAQECCQELRKHGHLDCLSTLLQYPTSQDFNGAAFGLYILLGLSRQWDSQDTPSQFCSHFLPEHLAKLVAQTIVETPLKPDLLSICLGAYGGDLNPEVDEEAAKASIKAQVLQNLGEMLQWLFLYLKAAKDGGLLDQELTDSVVKGYTGWCKAYADDCQEEGLVVETSQYMELAQQLHMVFLGGVPK